MCAMYHQNPINVSFDMATANQIDIMSSFMDESVADIMGALNGI